MRLPGFITLQSHPPAVSVRLNKSIYTALTMSTATKSAQWQVWSCLCMPSRPDPNITAQYILTQTGGFFNFNIMKKLIVF